MNSRFFYSFELNFCMGGVGLGVVFLFKTNYLFPPSLQCLLVKGWKVGASWSFPRGKRNKDEEDHTCAVREVNFCLYHVHACSLFSFLSAPYNFFEAYCTCSDEIYYVYIL